MEHPKTESLTLSVAEAAAELGCSTRFLYELCRRDDCSFSFRLGRKIRISRSDFQNFIAEQVHSGVRR